MRDEKIKVLPHTGGRTNALPKDNLTRNSVLVKSKNSKIKIPGKAPGNLIGRLQATGESCVFSCLNSPLGDCGRIISNYSGLVKYFSSQSGLFSGAGAPVSHPGCAQGKETGGERVNPLSPGFFEKTGGNGGSSPSVGDINLIIWTKPRKNPGGIQVNMDLNNDWQCFKEDLREIFKRNRILKMGISQIYHRFNPIIKEFHKEFGLFEGAWSKIIHEHEKTGEWAILCVRRQENARRNVYDAIRYSKRQAQKFMRLTRALQENQRGFFMAVFTVPYEISVEKMKKLRRSLSELLKRHKFKHFAIIFHHWGDRNLCSEHPHFHVVGVSRKLYLSRKELEEIKKSWGRILKYRGEIEAVQEKVEEKREDMEIEKKDYPVVWWGYTYKSSVAMHFYLYSVRPYLLDVFCAYAKGENIDREAFKQKLEKWEAKGLRKVEFYGGLRNKVEGEDFDKEKSEWRRVKNIYDVQEEGRIWRGRKIMYVYSYREGGDSPTWLDNKFYCLVDLDGKVVEKKLRENPLKNNVFTIENTIENTNVNTFTSGEI